MGRPKGSKNKPKPRKPRTPEEISATNRANKVNNLRLKKYTPKKYVGEQDPTFDYLADIYSPRAVIDPEIKLGAVQAYMVTGDVIKASKLSGVSHQTIYDWKNKSEWWPIVLSKLRKEKQDELDAKFTELIHKALDRVEDRIINGDEVITKDGDSRRKLMGGRDLTTSLAILYDKRALVRGDPTSMSGKVDITSQLDSLKQEFAAMAREELEKSLVKDITPKEV